MKKNDTIKRFLTLILSCFGFLLLSAQDNTFSYNNLNYITLDDTTAAVYDNNYVSGAIEIPSQVEYNGKPYTVTEIGDNAFNSSTITSITLPDTISSIGAQAFYYSTDLTSINLNEGIETIGDSAFEHTGLTSITTPSTLTSIGNKTFYESYLTSATLNEGLQTIGDSAFEYTGLTSISLPSTVTSIGTRAFVGCSNLTTATLNEGLETIGDVAFAGTGLTSISLPSTVTSIGTRAFQSCGYLTTATLNEGLETIGHHAFAYAGLTNLSIPNSVISIGYGAFKNCKDLTLVTLNEGLETIGDYAFGDSGLTSISIPSTVTSIEDSVFAGCQSLESVTLGENVANIGESAFYNCRSLTRFTSLATTPPSVGYDAFGYYETNWQENCDLFVPYGAKAAYNASPEKPNNANKNYMPWKSFKSITELPSLSTSNIKIDPINIYPNPAKDLASINNLKIGAVISIYNAAGNLVYSTTAKSSKATINTSKFANGLYFVSIDGKSSTKLLIAK